MYPKVEYQLSRFSGASPNYKYKKHENREPCPLPPPPPKPKAADDSLLWGAMFLATIAAGIAVYAKRSPEIRDWMTIYAPWFDDLIAILYQENMTYKELAEQCIISLKKYIHMDDKKSEICEIDEVTGNAKIIPTVPVKPIEPPKESGEDNTEKPPCKVLPPPVLTKDICKVEDCLIDLYETVINNYDTAKAACAYYNQLVEEIMTDFSIPKLKDLNKAMNERLELVKVSLNNADNAEGDMDDLTRYIDCGVQAPPEKIEKVKSLLEDCFERVKAARIQFEWENDKSVVLDKLWQKVESQINRYTEETEVMIPGLQYAQNKLKLDGDPDLLLYHTYRYTAELQRELNDAVAAMRERVNRAVDTVLPQGEKESKERKELMATTLKEKRAEVEAEYKKREQDQNQRNEALLKEALNKQLQRHEESLQVTASTERRRGQCQAKTDGS
ncbi:unnamed protein product, partial [Iphiclides podalirius]